MSRTSVLRVASARSVVRLAAAAIAGAVVLGSVPPPVVAQSGNRTIYVSALDPLKKPIAGLAADTWAVKEDDKDCPVVSSKPATDPLDVVLMIDTSVNAQPTIGDLRAGLVAFAQAVFAGPAPVTMSVVDVAAADVTVAENKKTLDDVVKVLNKTFADRAGNTVMLEGVVDVAKTLKKSAAPRRAMVVVNLDGVPDASRSNMNDVVAAVLASGASVWAVTYQNTASRGINQNLGAGDPSAGTSGGMVGSGAVGQNLSYFLSRAPESTGGMRDQLQATTALPTSLTTIANALVGQYALTYTRAGNSAKTLELGQTRPDATILYATAPIK